MIDEQNAIRNYRYINENCEFFRFRNDFLGVVVKRLSFRVLTTIFDRMCKRVKKNNTKRRIGWPFLRVEKNVTFSIENTQN